MSQLPKDDTIMGCRYALCVGIGTYTELTNRRNLRYAAADAKTIAERLADPQRGNFAITLLAEPDQTHKTMLDDALDQILNAPDRKAEDLVVIYFSCHGDVYRPDNTFCLLPSNATLQADGTFKRTTVIGIYDLTKMLSGAKVHNIIVLLDVCHSGGAGVALQHLKLDLSSGPNIFIIGAARQDQTTMESSQLEHGIFTNCLLRAFAQPPNRDGWLTVSQIQSFVSDEIHWYAKDHPIQIQGWSVFVNPNLPLLRNPAYPELCPLPPLWNVPSQRNPFFTGQEDVLVRLATILQSDQKTALTQPQAISGLGGIGKTQLALEYAYRHRQDYHAVLWGRADTREALISTFVTIAHLLDLPQKDEQDQLITVEAVKAWLARRSKWLLILDNADELAMVKEFILLAFQGHLLLTTRAQVMGALAHKIEVETMRPEVGALLLLCRAGLIAPDAPLEQSSPADVTVAKELSEEMGGLPLALDQAGAYIEETACSLSHYLQLYHTHSKELLAQRGSQFSDYPHAVATTWSLSFQKVEQANPAAAELLRLCAFLYPDAIPEEIITDGASELGPVLEPTAADPVALDAALADLRRYSLLWRNPDSKALTIHRLVQAVLKDEMNEQQQQEWAARTVRTVNCVFPQAEVAAWPVCQRYLPHALKCAALIQQWNLTFAEAARLLRQTGAYLCGRAQYTDAKPLLEHALTLYEKALGPDHPETANSLIYLAILYADQGTYEQSKPLMERARVIYEQVRGSDHPETAMILGNLAGLYYYQGNYEQAELLYQRVLTIYEKALGSDHLDTVTTLGNLAALYADHGNYEQAEPLYQRALTIYEQVRGSDHLSTARVRGNLAILYYNQGNYEQSKLLLERALPIYEKVLGPDHPQTVEVRENYAELLQKMNQETE